MWIELALVGVVLLLYLFLKSPEDVWKCHGVRQRNSTDIFGNIQVFLGKKSMADMDQAIYKEMGKDEKFCGMNQMQRKILLVKDMEVVKKVLIKDFDHFVDRREMPSGQKMMNRMLINMHGDEWKGTRASLSPTFTTGKIRRMMGIFNQVSTGWMQHLQERAKKENGSLTLIIPKETIYYTLEVIAAAAFGMDAGIVRNPDTLFSKMFHKIMKLDLLATIKFVLAMVAPKVIKFFGINLMNSEAMDYFENILSQAMKERMEGKVKRNDFIQLIVEARKGELKGVGSDELDAFEKDAQITTDGKKNYLNDDEIANAQMLLFFFAGASTTSNLIGFAKYMLALHPDVQTKLREEVNSKLFSGGDGKSLDYEALNRLEYLDMFVSEVLRKFPPVGRLERLCVRDYHDPSINLKVPKGAIVGIPCQAIHNDTEYYDYPDKFYPEHFSPENKAKRNIYSWMPFGIGPRNCIGMRFALVASKAALAHLVHNFVIEPTAKTPIPAKVKPIGVGAQLPDDLELKVTLIDKK